MKGQQPPDKVAIDAWWKAVLAGGVDEPHPVHGDDLRVSIRHGVLHLTGALPTEEDRQELLQTAEKHLGHAIEKVDAEHLKIVKRKEKQGILDQTLIAAFPNRAVAELTRNFLVDIRRLKPKQLEILDRGQEDVLRRLVPQEFVGDIEKAFDGGEAVLIVRVDETDAFKVREMLAEDTRSRWTVSTPPTAADQGRG
jgi:hypothetical protein